MKIERLLGTVLGCVCENVVVTTKHIVYEYSGESRLIWEQDSITIEEFKGKFKDWYTMGMSTLEMRINNE